MKTGKFPLLVICVTLLLQSVSAQITPGDIPGLEMWLRSDQGMTIVGGALISDWVDISGNGHDCYNPIGLNYVPSPINNALNGFPAARFYGYDDFLDFPEIADIRTVFWVVKEDPIASTTINRQLLGHYETTDFHRGLNKALWHPTLSNPNVLNGITRINFSEVDGTVATVPTDYCIISLVTAGEVAASSVTLDNVQIGVWQGDFVELIIYTTALSPEEVLQVETYLDERYTSPFFADEDVFVPSGFCDTTICAVSGFSGYEWSNGMEGECISVNNSGDYIVQVHDQFNRIRTDTVHVQFTGNTEEQNQLVCLGQSFTWDLQLDGSIYTIEWFDGDNSTSRSFAEEGVYSVEISDQNNCTLQTQLVLNVDSLPIGITLGPDTDLCSGNSLSLQPNNYQNLTYEWSTLETTPSIEIESSGQYSVHVTNQNDCEAFDTVNVQIIGVAPKIAFEATSFCEGTATQFTALNLDLSTISNWSWVIEGQNYSGENVSHIFASSGDYLVQLHAETVEGCGGDYSALVHIIEVPVAAFTYGSSCSNAITEFTDNSTSVEGAITNLDWSIAGQLFTGAEVSAIIPQAGFNPVVLVATTEFGCAGSFTTQVFVNAPPVASFEYSGTCDGDLTSFEETVDESQSGPIDDYTWLFDDGTGSLSPNPNHFYLQTGIYNVSLAALAENGCSDTTIQAVTIHELPVVEFEVLNGCVSQPFLLQESVITFDDPVINWHWMVQGVGEFDIQAPVVVFPSTGFHAVTLEVLTENGCEASLTQNIPVWNLPVAEFDFTPQIGSAPFQVQFINQSINAANYNWNFGDGGSSTLQNPVHIFNQDTTFMVTLVVTNAYGCTDQYSAPLIVAVPNLDIQVQDIHCDQTTSGQQISFQLVNAGNLPLHLIELSWKIGNQAPVIEIWLGSLEAGQSEFFTFTSQMVQEQSQFDYLCVSASDLEYQFAETELANNQVCKSLDENSFELFPPFPNPGDQAMFVRFITPLNGNVDVRIIDSRGRVWQQWVDNNVQSGFHQYFIQIESLADGNYVLEISQNGKVQAESFVKVTK